MNQSAIYAKNLRMEINEKNKTSKVLVLRKGCKKKWLPQKWQIGDKMIEEAKSYKYLGFGITNYL